MSTVKELTQFRPEKETLLTIGVFDGVHVGHQALLTRLRDEARRRNLLSGVLTFSCHPQRVLHPESKLLWLSDLDTRVRLIKELGIDFVVPFSFTREIAKLTAREFVQLLKEQLKMRGLIVGPDFALGKNREGDTNYLRKLEEEMGFTVEDVSPVISKGEVISSSAIRNALVKGDVSKVERFFGRPYSIRGPVVTGDGRGRTLGFPTANIDVSPEQALPANGVYVTLTCIDNKSLPSVTNIGIRPTFGEGKRMVETFIMDYNRELGGQMLTIDLVEKLRDEKRFDDVEGLKAQMEEDVKQARIQLEQKTRQHKERK